MPSKNPSTPTRTRATSTPRSAAPRRVATRTATPAEPAAQTVADAQGSAADAIAAPAASSINYAEYVRTRAYYLHLERKGRPGNPVEDWLAAEREFGSGAGGNA